ncbi:hypothetical protein AAY473_039885, partial [Plecturocebus cupreus]
MTLREYKLLTRQSSISPWENSQLVPTSYSFLMSQTKETTELFIYPKLMYGGIVGRRTSMTCYRSIPLGLVLGST